MKLTDNRRAILRVLLYTMFKNLTTRQICRAIWRDDGRLRNNPAGRIYFPMPYVSEATVRRNLHQMSAAGWVSCSTSLSGMYLWKITPSGRELIRDEDKRLRAVIRKSLEGTQEGSEHAKPKEDV